MDSVIWSFFLFLGLVLSLRYWKYLKLGYLGIKTCFQIVFRDNTLPEARKIGNILVVPYRWCGNDYKVFLPYNRSLTPKMSNYKITLEEADKPELEIKQQPGVRILLTENDIPKSAVFSCVNTGSGETRKVRQVNFAELP